MNQISSLISERKAQIKGMVERGEIPDRYEEVGVDEFLTPENFEAFASGNLAPFDRLPLDLGFLGPNFAEIPIFLHVRWDQEFVIKKAAEVYAQLGSTAIYLDGTEGQRRDDPYPAGVPRQIFSGKSEWQRGLMDAGVDSDDIFFTGPAYNTPDEHDELVNLAIAQSWEAAIVIGVGYQMPRIALGTVQKMRNRGHWIETYFAVPELGDLDIPMKGAQGNDEGPRRNQFWAEFMRIPEYQIKNDLCSLKELLWYLGGGRNQIIDNSLQLIATA